jgi:hypothetical protein
VKKVLLILGMALVASAVSAQTPTQAELDMLEQANWEPRPRPSKEETLKWLNMKLNRGNVKVIFYVPCSDKLRGSSTFHRSCGACTGMTVEDDFSISMDYVSIIFNFTAETDNVCDGEIKTEKIKAFFSLLDFVKIDISTGNIILSDDKHSSIGRYHEVGKNIPFLHIDKEVDESFCKSVEKAFLNLKYYAEQEWEIERQKQKQFDNMF